MTEQFKNMMVHAGVSWVLWFLITLSVAAIAVMIDRLRVFWAHRDDVSELVKDVHTLLARRDVEAARTRLAASPNPEATIALAGLAQWKSGATAAQEAMAAASGLQRARLEKRLLFLGTVGNNAPFVGLLGTVIGVVGAFEELGKNGPATSSTLLAPERVMSTIAEALVATAAGLVVAIPAVAAYNYFQGLLATTLANAETLGHVLLTHIGGASRASESSKIVDGEHLAAGGE